MSAGERIPLAEAREIAAEVVALLGQSCERIEVAGSARRGDKPDVGDVEIVVVPKLAAAGDLFGEVAAYVDLLEVRVQTLVADGVLARRVAESGATAMGPKHKRLVYKGTALDLFSTTASQFGLIFLIRTGPGTFSKRLVTPRHLGGLMPMGFRVQGGVLWDRGRVVLTPDEQAVFSAIGVPYIEPGDRHRYERVGLPALAHR